MRHFRYAAFVIAAVLAPTLLFAAGDSTLPSAVSISFPEQNGADALLPVQFLAPIAGSGTPESSAVWLVGPGGMLLCQVCPSQEPQALDYAWYEVTAFPPCRNETYILEGEAGPLPDDRPLVATAVYDQAASLDTGQVRLEFDKGRFSIVNTASVLDRTLVPKYVTGLVNSQQGVELVLMDRIRHVDFTLRPAPNPEFAVEGVGPVMTTAVYRGAFAGVDNFPPVKYEARISLAANGIMGLDLRIPRGAFDDQVQKVREIRVTLPLVLQRAAALSFGAETMSVRGRGFWQGQSSLMVAADGSYRFTDGDKTALSGSRKALWVDYRDADAGVGIVWGEKQFPIDLKVNYDEDLIEFSITPTPSQDCIARARVYFAFNPLYSSTGTLAAIAAQLDNPPSATVSKEYIRAITGAK